MFKTFVDGWKELSASHDSSSWDLHFPCSCVLHKKSALNKMCSGVLGTQANEKFEEDQSHTQETYKWLKYLRDN